MSRLLPAASWFFLAATATAQAPLPVVALDPSDWASLRQQCRRLAHAADHKAFLTAEALQGLRTLLAREAADPVEAVRAVQMLLDPACLIGVSINPESRVKAVRGPGAARLTKDQDSFVLVKVHNEAGVTAALGVGGPQVISGNRKSGDGRWLEVELVSRAPPAPRLLGQRLEYVVLRLRPREAGKREATLKFDVGQGSQDLGFRAEVPILFHVQARQ